MLTQEQFDTVVTHLLTQNEQSSQPDVDENGEPTNDTVCMYRGPRELKCAIGALIPHHRYNPAFERLGLGYDGYDEREPPIYKELRDAADIGHDKNSIVQATRLQNLHDETDPCTWPKRLRDFAASYDLAAYAVDRMEIAA